MNGSLNSQHSGHHKMDLIGSGLQFYQSGNSIAFIHDQVLLKQIDKEDKQICFYF